MVRVMVAVVRLQHLYGHAKITCGGPEVAAALHEPSSGRVPQRMRGDAFEAGGFRRPGERFVDASYGPAVPFDHGALAEPKTSPAPQMRQKARG
jgi:hypothetical protein